jgi:hypothetical protein
MSKRVAANVPSIPFRRLRDSSRYNPSPKAGQPFLADSVALNNQGRKPAPQRPDRCLRPTYLFIMAVYPLGQSCLADRPFIRHSENPRGIWQISFYQ